MKTSLVGYTGFVGGNLAASHRFDRLYNSRNIGEAFGERQELVVYCGVRAEKFLANRDPEGDRAVIAAAEENITRMKPEKLVLISTADIYKTPVGVDEDTPIDTQGLHPYGLDRWALEQWARENVRDCTVVRLPALVGRGLKKNTVFDLLHLTPSMLNAEKYRETAARSALAARAYRLDEATGFYKLQPLAPDEAAALRAFFDGNDFNALSFTNGDSAFQFYDLRWLWDDLGRILAAGAPLVNITSEPVTAKEVRAAAFGRADWPAASASAVRYDIGTKYAALFAHPAGRYGYGRAEILGAIAAGVRTGAFL